ncbi:MAG: glycoside hydrolase family 88 protein [Thermoanaerobaculales bacterium]|nr:glycoside hydrolase family 88 protein [Thermoanaerobaculales bacterium]
MRFIQNVGQFALGVLTIAVAIGCGGPPAEEKAAEEKAAEEAQIEQRIFSRSHINTVMMRAFDWQIDNIVYQAPLPDGGFQDVSDTEWVRGAFFSGVMAAYEATGNPKYLNAAKEISERNGWKPGPRPRHADDHCIAQTYARIFLVEGDPSMIAATAAQFDEMIADPRPGAEVGWAEDDNWSWCDALFMAPPTMALVAEATDDLRYLDLMNDMWWQTYDYLYDPEEHLWYRDGRYVIQEDGSGPRTSNGQKIFWSRGNGWVFAGLALVLEHMPADYPDRPRYEELFRQMAEALAAVQGKDGLWRSSLLDAEEIPVPEASGSGFFTFGLAWGVNHGLLDADTFLPAVHKGWAGMNWAQQPDGRIGWVQQIGYDPRSVTAEDTMEYGTGAFLLAGSEMLKLAESATD